MKNDKEFGAILKQLRQETKMSQKEVCRKLGFSQQNISSWETGKAIPASDALLKLLRLYEVDNIMEVFGYESEKDSSFKMTKKEQSLVEKLRALPNPVRDSFKTIVDSYYDEIQKVEENEIYLAAASGSEGLSREDLEDDVQMLLNMDEK